MKTSFENFIYNDFLSIYIKNYVVREKALKKIIKFIEKDNNNLNEEIRKIFFDYDEETKLRVIKSKTRSKPEQRELDLRILSEIKKYEDGIISDTSKVVDKTINDIIKEYETISFVTLKTKPAKKIIGSFKNKDIYKHPFKKLLSNWTASKRSFIYNKIFADYKQTNNLQNSIDSVLSKKKLYSRHYANLRILLRAVFVSSETYTHEEIYKLNSDKLDFIYTSILERNNTKICKKNNNKLVNSELNGAYPQLHPNCVVGNSKIDFFDQPSRYFKSKIEKNTIIIKHNNGSINLTPTHEILTLDGWKMAKDINNSDYLCIIGSHSKLKAKTVKSKKLQLKIKGFLEKETFFSKVINISVDNKKNIVYNYTTNCNFYACDGVIVHNCNSTVIPTFKLSNGKYFKPEEKNLNEWFSSLSKNEKIKLIGSRNYKKLEADNYNFPDDYFKVLF